MAKRRLNNGRRSLGPFTGVIASATRTLISYGFVTFILIIYYLNSDSSVLNTIITKLNGIAALKPIAVYINSHKIQSTALIASIVSSVVATRGGGLIAVQPLGIYLSKEQSDYKSYIPLVFMLSWIINTRSQKLRLSACAIALALYIWGWWGAGLF